MNTTTKEKKETIIGIDLGTTNSLVSFTKKGSPRIIPNERGSRTTPSVVSIKPDGTEIIGEMARNQSVLNADHTVANIKLKMGTDQPRKLYEHNFLPEEVSGLILAKLKENAENYLGQDIDNAVITVPAYFDDNQRRATMKAAAMAGIKVRKLLNEPTAAALAYGLGGKQPDSKMLVLDLGGGTLDITLMEYKEKAFMVRAVGGSTSIGGLNFDKQIIDYIVKDFKANHSFDLSADNVAYQQLVIQAEKAKVDLSSVEETTIMIPYIAISANGPLHLNMTISRKKFAELIAPILLDIKQIIETVFEKCGLGTDWVDSIIMVGGSTRIPAIEAMVLGIVDPLQQRGDSSDLIKKAINQDEAVARGAAIMAGILAGELEDIEFNDITSHDLGILNHEGEFEVLVPEGSIYPMETTRLFSTAYDNQEEVVIEVMQKRASNEDFELVRLGNFNLTVSKGKKRGTPDIDVTFGIDLNELLTVTALDLDSCENAKIAINYALDLHSH